MRSVASTKTGGIGTDNAASVADVEGDLNKERPGQLAGPLLKLAFVYLLGCPLFVWLSLGVVALALGVVAVVDGCHFSELLFTAAGVLHELPGRMQFGSGAGAGAGSGVEIVRPASEIASAPQPFVSLTVTLVSVLLPVRLIVSMSMTADEPSSAVPLQTCAAAGSAIRFTVKPAPVRHSRRLPPTIRSVLWVVPSLKVSVTLPTTVWSYHRYVLAELSSR